MKKILFQGPVKFVTIPVFAFGVLSLVSYIVMQLWNCLLPDILHVAAITFWQAMGIFVLCKILFGFGKGGGRGWGGPGGPPWMRRKMEEKYKKMTPEEREAFRKKMSDRFCGHGPNWGPWDKFDQDERKPDQSFKDNE
ncbi:hypothetical protein [Mucilaginibacter myungsuensis]|uniref:Uncharacterized protein n=1 Tax=Mucilaginibacter myungsuensis TaxID=649104 RepID=A0A929KVT8_9SPHI|nr:hypothetical protein [Mucilaginibacter myungsuensis]MBE9662082.1 hypothetical protein [Mucilaginibacter myungsuensis]MDN3599484.1 hypothetical protein [Mucilaginibacter myungsuensis]